MALSPIALCSHALMKIGATPIQSFQDETVEASLASSFYASCRDALLSAYPWRFATAQTRLPQLQQPPLTEFPFAFQLPPDCIRVLSIGSGSSSRGVHYRRLGNTLHCAAQDIKIDYIARIDDRFLPEYFEQALIARLAAEFCLPLTENSSRAETMYRLAENELERAKRIDAQQDSPRAIDDFNLINVR